MMTLEQYLANPLGKNNAIMSNAMRETLKTTYKNKFNNILLRENGKIDYYAYKDTQKNIYYIHVKVPSEVVKNFYYDVVFKFFASEDVKEGGRNLEKYNVQFFSNDPVFVYTYTHAFLTKGLFIKELASKMSKEALQRKAVEKNPDELPGYAKILYFGYLFLKERDLLKTVRFGDAPNIDMQLMLSRIEHADKVIEDRQREGAKISSKKKILIDKNLERKINAIGVSDKAKERLVVGTNKAQKVKKVKSINSTKNVSKIKKKK